MANELPLNKFRLVSKTLTSVKDTIYSTPTGVTAIVLSCQVANTGNQIETVTATVERSGSIEEYTILKDGKIPIGDALNPLTGKLVLEVGDIFYLSGSSSNLDTVLSVLENANE
jgi:hypothetical protein